MMKVTLLFKLIIPDFALNIDITIPIVKAGHSIIPFPSGT